MNKNGVLPGEWGLHTTRLAAGRHAGTPGVSLLASWIGPRALMLPSSA
jgi:hypothetical protein